MKTKKKGLNEKRDLCSKPQRSSLSQGHWCVVFTEINQCFNQVQISCISLEVSYKDLGRKKLVLKAVLVRNRSSSAFVLPSKLLGRQGIYLASPW